MSLVQAAAWRTKYALQVKVKVRIENLGVHRNNRAGVYPAGIRCKELCGDVLPAGFLKEEFEDKLVAVEEMPAHEARNYPDRQTGSQYNKELSSKDDLLKTCFIEPYDNVQYNLLAHNHMALVIKAFITKAKWDLEPVEQKKMNRTIKFCDEQGRLCQTAVAATANGAELVHVINEGVMCQVLSWKMEVEEPGAAAIISHALNKCASLAMRTTEWSALYTLKGGIIKESGRLGERVAFKSVLEATSMELDSAAEDPDEDDCDDDEHETAMAAMCDDLPTVAADDKTCEDSAKGLCGEHAEALHRNKVQIAALQGSIEAIKLTGQIKVVQHMEREIATLRRRQRGLCSEFPAVADAFKRQRVAEEQEARDKMFAARQAKELRQSAQTAVAAKKAALAALAKAKRAHEDVERKQAQTAAFKTFSLDMLGGNSSNAGGAAARKNRFQVLDRVGTHLSPAQRNDFEWWKRAWDDAMVEQHKGKWAETFAGWMQEIINKPDSNAFSVFMHNETNRVLKEKVKNVLAVPGGN